MWMVTSSVLLATLLVSGLSFPHPDTSEYKIPDVGTGRRAQYYVLHSDGTFKYGFDTGDGAYEQAMSKSAGSQQGSFGYTDPDGREIKLEYESGKGGFVARGDHLPQPVSDVNADTVPVVTKRARPFSDPLANTGADASYNFGFSSDSHSRNEQSDATGQVTGSYNYIDENGLLREFNYQAGRGIGFQISGQGLATPNQPTRRSQQNRGYPTAQRSSFPRRQHEDANVRTANGEDGEYSFTYRTDTHSRSETGDRDQNVEGNFEFKVPEDDVTRRVEYEAGSDTGFIVRSDHLPVGPSVPGAEDGKPSGQFVRQRTRSSFVDPLADSDSDASYNFAFESDSYSRSESADKDGNVAGSYSLVEEDGTRVTNEFRGGKGIGFEIKEVSRVPGTPITSSFKSTYQQPSIPTKTASDYANINVQPTHSGVSSQFDDFFRSTVEHEDANIQTSSGDGGAYSFSYGDDTQSRSESGDENNKVVGQFSFTADDGINRELEYEAGRETGFIVSADHLPVGPSVPGAEDGKPTGQFARHQKKVFVDPLAGTDSDSSYDFGFKSDTYSRSETADEDGNVVGSYTVVEDDGTRVTTDFRAGKGIGFEIMDIRRVHGSPPATTRVRSEHHAAPYTPPKQSVQTAFSGTAQRTPVKHHTSYHPTPQTKSNFEPANIASSTGENGEYSFSYNTDTHSRAETGDSDNNVAGEFSFIADDGIRRELEYEAGKETGFIVEADHLPVGPSVPGAEDGRPSGQFARHQKSDYVDPLASSGESDASYKFSFDSDTYSRSEQSDKDGNVEGTFTITDDTGKKVTNKFRAGKGVGYEVKEVSSVSGVAPSRSSTSSRVSTQGFQSTKLAATPYSSQRGSRTRSRGSSGATKLSTRKQSTVSGTRGRHHTSSIQRKSRPATVSRHDDGVMVKSGDIPGSTVVISPEYSIYRYDSSPDAEKFGYVIQYN